MSNRIESFVIILIFFLIKGNEASNLTCYQCVRNTNTECGVEDLLQCPEVSDRCVTHISKNEDGFIIKRECGLGPCGFDDPMVSKGLGFGDCNRNRNEYFCIFCCRENGCNKNSCIKTTPVTITILLSAIFVVFANNF